jgi:hypothetical protein
MFAVVRQQTKPAAAATAVAGYPIRIPMDLNLQEWLPMRGTVPRNMNCLVAEENMMDSDACMKLPRKARTICLNASAITPSAS